MKKIIFFGFVSVACCFLLNLEDGFAGCEAEYWKCFRQTYDYHRHAKTLKEVDRKCGEPYDACMKEKKEARDERLKKLAENSKDRETFLKDCRQTKKEGIQETKNVFDEGTCKNEDTFCKSRARAEKDAKIAIINLINCKALYRKYGREKK